MSFELKPELIRPDFISANEAILTSALLFIPVCIVAIFIAYKTIRVYPIIRVALSASETGIKSSAYQLTSTKEYKRLYNSNKISPTDANIINNIKYQPAVNVSLNLFRGILWRITIKAIIGGLNGY